jgi:hypothetical protein
VTIRLIAIAFVAALLAPALAAPAAAAPLCADAVMNDWLDGRIDKRYPPRCYGAALDALPEDVRAYSTASDDISRALQARVRELRARSDGDDRGSAVDATVASLPIPLVLGAAVGSLLLLGVLAQLVARRLRNSRVAHRPTRPIGQW